MRFVRFVVDAENILFCQLDFRVLLTDTKYLTHFVAIRSQPLRFEFSQCFLQELINRILQLQAHNNQLINLLKKEQVTAAAEKAAASKEDGKPKNQRKFQFPTYEPMM